MSWSLLTGVLFGLISEYAPLIDDPSADRSVGDAAAKAVLFGVAMSGIAVTREILRTRRESEVGSDA